MVKDSSRGRGAAGDSVAYVDPTKAAPAASPVALVPPITGRTETEEANEES